MEPYHAEKLEAIKISNTTGQKDIQCKDNEYKGKGGSRKKQWGRKRRKSRKSWEI